ncbi:thiol-disulfide oxidoreductase DCC family protein [Botrimarina hoheduenensis]|uniref:Thiol-disulfide oxidoreductase n=1 Tax=Botrimarina hoheduenensis TaxID=2528000 RepID=A0A5C5WBN4_9BACT|nr:DUF393 domain-containing protein [Botrimarina hoheduenensis]TWT47505.1 hypothetical protein Pla111_11190 [Botrimarina hoheduenensis]
MPASPPALPPPDTDVVLYDGECAFCRARMEQLRWFDRPLLGLRGHRLAYLSLHAVEVATLYPQVPHQRLLEEMVVVDPQGRIHGGADAVRHLSRRLPRLWWLAPILHLPGSKGVWRALYRCLARNRYRLGGRVADCHEGVCAIRR